jgi:hypothetical protein
MHVGQNSSALASVPAVIRDAVGNAAVHGFHDAVLALIALSIVGLLLAFLLKPVDNGENA